MDDFKARLDSLQPVWDNIVPGFHHWLKQWRSEMFIECLILSATERVMESVEDLPLMVWN